MQKGFDALPFIQGKGLNGGTLSTQAKVEAHHDSATSVLLNALLNMRRKHAGPVQHASRSRAEQLWQQLSHLYCLSKLSLVSGREELFKSASQLVLQVFLGHVLASG